MQSNDGSDTHTKDLRFAFDFALPVGTPLLAAADGVVVAAVGSFTSGNRNDKEMRARANFIALRHGPRLYSRYYHLCERGVDVAVGERVHAGQPIGRSGNTGFSGSPHLHWDVVDLMPQETATLALVATPCSQHEEAAAMEPVETPLQCVAGCFSAPLPPLGQPLAGRIVLADPPTANVPLRNEPSEARGSIILVDRCPHVDFIDKAKAAEAIGAAAIVVVNYAESGPGLLTMGLPALARVRTVSIPALMINHADGATVRAAVAAVPAHTPPQMRVGRSEHFISRREIGDSAASDRLLPESKRMSDSEFVPHTLPVRFLWPGHPRGYLPRCGSSPPQAVQRGIRDRRRWSLFKKRGEGVINPSKPMPKDELSGRGACTQMELVASDDSVSLTRKDG